MLATIFGMLVVVICEASAIKNEMVASIVSEMPAVGTPQIILIIPGADHNHHNRNNPSGRQKGRL